MLLGVEDTLERHRALGYVQTQDSSMEIHADVELSSPKPVLRLFHSTSSPSLHFEIELRLDDIKEAPTTGPADTQIVPRDILEDLPDSTFVETQIIMAGDQKEDTNLALLDDTNPSLGETQIELRDVPHRKECRPSQELVPSNEIVIDHKNANILGDTQIVHREVQGSQETQLVEEQPIITKSQKLGLAGLEDSPSNQHDARLLQLELEDSILNVNDKNYDSLSRSGTQVIHELASYSGDGDVSDAQKEPHIIKTSKNTPQRPFSQEIPLLGFPEPPISQSSPTRAVPSASVVQIPNTVERNRITPTQLLAQVQNTQEDVSDVTFQNHQREERPVYLSSQKQEINTDESDVETKEIEEALNQNDEIYIVDEKLLDEEISIKMKQEEISSVKQGEQMDQLQHLPDQGSLDVSRNLIQNRKRKRKRNLVLSDLQLLSDLSTQKRVIREEALVTIDPEDIIHPHSVWAEYKFKMYPGILIDSRKDTLTVKFDDLVSEIKNSDLHQLDVRVGDRLRYKGGTYEVTGLLEKIGKDNDRKEVSIHCIRGYNHAYIQKVSKRRTAEILVPISRCFMEIEDWMEHEQKFKTPGLSTQLFFPPTRSRQNDHILDAILKPEEVKKRNGVNPTYSKLQNPKQGVFDNCLFMLTNNDDKRNDLQKKITDNGGAILELLEEVVTYKSTSSGLEIALDHLKDFHFAAVISSGYCRSAKYLQVLAIGWPVLANSFIYDTIKLNKLELWPSYLLPAGQLQVLQTTTSCNTYKFRQNHENSITLDMQLSNNRKILGDIHVVVVKGKLEQAKINMDACNFIFHALGAFSLEFTSTLSQAVKKCTSFIESGEKCLVYVNICSLETLRSHTNTNERVKRRKRGGLNSSLNNYEVDVIDWEWVVQCVISSHAWSPAARISA